MPLTRVSVLKAVKLVGFAGYRFPEPLPVPEDAVLELEIPFQRSPQYAPRLAVVAGGRATRFMLGQDDTWSPVGPARLPGGSSNAPSLPVATLECDAAS